MAEKKNILLDTPHGEIVISVEEKDYEVALALLHRESRVWKAEAAALKNTSYHVFNELGELMKKHEIKADFYEISSKVMVEGERR